MDLKELQEQLSLFLYTSRPKGEMEVWIEKFLEVNSPEEIQSRLKVYRNNLAVTLIGSIRETFPVTEKLLSEDLFKLLARDFVYLYPSETHDLNRYGKMFPSYLSTLREVQTYPFLKDLAMLEWFWSECAELKDDFSLSADLAQEKLLTNGADSALKLRMSGRILEVSYDILSLWRNYYSNVNGPSSSEINFKEIPCRLFIWKDNFKRNVLEIENELWPVLSALQSEATLGQISEIPSLRENPSRLSECLQVLLIRGWLSAS
jgi:hypothetical protein